jgi:hypothetical protein
VAGLLPEEHSDQLDQLRARQRVRVGRHVPAGIEGVGLLTERRDGTPSVRDVRQGVDLVGAEQQLRLSSPRELLGDGLDLIEGAVIAIEVRAPRDQAADGSLLDGVRQDTGGAGAGEALLGGGIVRGFLGHRARHWPVHVDIVEVDEPRADPPSRLDRMRDRPRKPFEPGLRVVGQADDEVDHVGTLDRPGQPLQVEDVGARGRDRSRDRSGMPLDDAHLAPCCGEIAHGLRADRSIPANDAVETHGMTLGDGAKSAPCSQRPL